MVSRLNLVLAVALYFLPALAFASAFDDLKFGISAYEKRSFQEALAHLIRVQANSADYPRALYYKGLCELSLGLKKDGAETFRTLSQVAPNSQEAALAKQYLASTYTAIQQRIEDKATALLALPPNAPKHLKIPYRMRPDGWIHVDAFVHGIPLDMVWDTGASNCSLPFINVGKILPGTRDTQVETPNGLVNAQIGPVEIEVGGLRRNALTTIMSGTRVIGQSFFRDYEVEINREQHIIYLDYVGDTARGGTVAKVVQQPLSKFQVPFTREANLLLIDILVDGRPMKAYFDTGCAAKGIAMNRESAPSWGTVDLTLGPINRKNVPVTVVGGLSRPLVGPAFFGDRVYRIDPGRQVIDFDYVQE